MISINLQTERLTWPYKVGQENLFHGNVSSMDYKMEVKYFFCLKLKKSYFLDPSERHLHHFLLLLQLLQIMGFERGSWQRLAEDVVHGGRPEPAPTSHNMSLITL